jgi:predicted NUDIX family phosphoesterase
MSDHSEQHVLCVPKWLLAEPSREISFQPLTPVFFDRHFCRFYRRDLAEQDESYLQVIPYIVLLRYISSELHWFTYWRQPHASEQRLAGKRSIGLGGHIDIGDVLQSVPQLTAEMAYIHQVTGESIEELLYRAAIRELQEEIGLTLDRKLLTPVQIFYVGTNPVGRVHVGVLFSAVIPRTDLNPGPELHEPSWEPIRELRQPADPDPMEAWSREVINRYGDGIPAICQ